jgi:hypothetical protein
MNLDTRHRFTFHGPIRIWDLAERRMSLGGRDLWLAPEIQTSNLALGTEIVAKGYEAEAGERWVVDPSRSPASTPRSSARAHSRLATSLAEGRRLRGGCGIGPKGQGDATAPNDESLPYERLRGFTVSYAP